MSHPLTYEAICRETLDRLMKPHQRALVDDPEFISNAFDPADAAAQSLTPGGMVNLLMGEALSSLAMIAPFLRPGSRILEVGGGVGMAYAVLRSQGFDIVSLEPGSEGFGNRHQAGLRLLDMLGIDAGGWLKTGIEDFSPAGSSVDLVFSYFVLEHIPKLDQAFHAMAGLLAPDGRMIHRCPNYTIPFEPHLNIPLVPFMPEWTSWLYPRLRHRGIWQGLRFTTTGIIKKLCRRHGLVPIFRKGMTAWAFERVLTDPVFSSRKQGFVKLARLLHAAGMLNLLRRLPPMLDTPMEFMARKKSRN